MKRAVILHGKPGKKENLARKWLRRHNAKAHWLGWLQKQLMMNGYEVAVPEMPNADDPVWEDWAGIVDNLNIGPDTLLVGHSAGGGFWVKYLSLHKRLKAGKVILVAPWLDPEGDETKGFFDGFNIDRDLAHRTKGLVIFNSDNDMGNVFKSVAMIRDNITGIHYREFKNYGHFTFAQMKTTKFPELLDECLR